MYDVGGNIRRLRKLNMLNQNEFSKRIGISQGSLSEIESGTCNPSIETVISIYRTFNCSMEMLITGKESNGGIELDVQEFELLQIFRELNHKDKIELLDIASLKRRIL